MSSSFELILPGLIIPLIGTTLGASFVLFLKKRPGDLLQRSLIALSAGVMMAASFWSLLQPALNLSDSLGSWSFLPALTGFWLGILFLLAMDNLIPHLHMKAEHPEGPRSHLSRAMMLFLAVAIHNLPEGMAVGVIYVGLESGSSGITAMAALSLAIGIAVQNIPEGAIISFPLRSAGYSRKKAFFMGFLSGCVEPLGMILTVLMAGFFIPLLPYFLAFAAGAMIYVTVEELIPEISQGEHSNLTTIVFALGFSIMMILDVALG